MNLICKGRIVSLNTIGIIMNRIRNYIRKNIIGIKQNKQKKNLKLEMIKFMKCIKIDSIKNI